MNHYQIQIIILTKYGEFFGKKAVMNDEKYLALCEIAKNFYSSGGFELTLEDGGFIVIPPDVVQQSVLRIQKTKIDDNVQE
jgi:hypothetical protein